MITRHGQIQSMEMPITWQENSASNDYSLSSARLFRPSDDQNMAVALYYRGLPIDSDSAQLLIQILSVPAHSLNSAELERFGPLFLTSPFNDDFVVDSASTRQLNGRMIVYAIGRLHSTNKLCHRIFVQASANGQTVQEIWFVSGDQQHSSQIESFSQSLNSIVWETSNLD